MTIFAEESLAAIYVGTYFKKKYFTFLTLKYLLIFNDILSLKLAGLLIFYDHFKPF